MLNAFRHHWNLHLSPCRARRTGFPCSTPFGIIGIFTRPTDASKLSCSSAQRLSASLESSPLRQRPSRSYIYVLNAFRHHWNLHLRGDEDNDIIGQCSTPFGIIGIFTGDRRDVRAAAQEVLNAFRHHWNLHLQRHQLRSFFGQCSTPFGIIGIFTR